MACFTTLLGHAEDYSASSVQVVVSSATHVKQCHAPAVMNDAWVIDASCPGWFPPASLPACGTCLPCTCCLHLPHMCVVSIPRPCCDTPPPGTGAVLGAAGVDFDAALFNLLGPDYVARLMHKTGGGGNVNIPITLSYNVKLRDCKP